MKLIFAQGNPEPEHTGSRHNIGFAILNALAEDGDLKWKEVSKFHAKIAETTFRDEKIILVKPLTFYNETGPSLRKLVDFYKINPTNDLLVIHDDLALPFGTTRIRRQGADAGNNGIKSINAYIGQNYTRIKVGIYNEQREQIDDAAFVLAKFNPNEAEQIEKTLIPHIIKLIDQFFKGLLEHVSYKNIQ